MADLPGLFADWSTATLTDACVRLNLAVRTAPPGLRTVTGGAVAGPVRPARHYGSVDVFLEALEEASPGDVLVIDNDGRLDEGCIGDLTIIETRLAGLAGVVCWGAHRDTRELLRLGFPVFTYGSMPNGPLALRPRPEDALRAARVGPVTATAGDVVFADADGAVFVAARDCGRVLGEARTIRAAEREQANRAAAGRSLREQFRFGEFLARRAREPQYTLRQHLRAGGLSIEE